MFFIIYKQLLHPSPLLPHFINLLQTKTRKTRGLFPFIIIIKYFIKNNNKNGNEKQVILVASINHPNHPSITLQQLNSEQKQSLHKSQKKIEIATKSLIFISHLILINHKQNKS